jgi:osmoprotectant transport system permease protein
MRILALSLMTALSLSLSSFADDDLPTIRVGSKNFTESYVLAEIISQIIEDTGLARVERKFGLGNTGITFAALEEGSVDLYPEYTGTITFHIMKKPLVRSIDQLNEDLKRLKLMVSPSMGFNNTYAIALEESRAQELNVSKISDLRGKTDLRLGLSIEFLDRADGWPALKSTYGLGIKDSRGMEHALAYRALKDGSVDLIEVYSTDGQISKMNLRVLEDDRNFFPQYDAVLLAQRSLSERHPKVWSILVKRLTDSLNESEMSRLNALADIDRKDFGAIAAEFLGKAQPLAMVSRWENLGKLTLEHLFLVGVSVLGAVLLGVPLGILASRNRLLGQAVLVTSGLLQTIPSLALLCFLIPLFGIGTLPSLIALFLYALLPVVRGTYSGLASLDQRLLQTGIAMGLSPWQRLRLLELPMASISIMSGIKTSAIINVGTATLAAFIGAGGYGRLIVSGLALNNNETILWGAIPAALMAIFAHFLFELSDLVIVPKGLRLKDSTQ